MVKIFAPNKEYTGVSASVDFLNGVGETDNPALLNWFREHGYEVEGDKNPEGEKSLEDMSLEELQAYAEEKGIDLGKATTQEGVLKKIKESLE
ncbi:hypothetical protein [Clostridium polynesiense]|uniref:hypothetical protein n=1 Tax=Clostridium polynesiense TaxID=1325933 RepID=UPI0006935991|nr:hypothetical protein [Clostridium polynesiense]